MAADEQLIATTAARYGIPPAILFALGQQATGFSDTAVSGQDRGSGAEVGAFQITPAQARSFGYQPGQLKGDLALQLDLTAQLLMQSFDQTGDWQQALSVFHSGDPQAHQNPVAPTGGFVNSVLGIAASHADYGMDQLSAGADVAMSRMLPSSSNFATQIQRISGMGGVVDQNAAQRYSGAMQAWAGQSAAGAGLAQTTAKNLPFSRFEAMPFASGAMGAETENFGYQWAGTTEVGNDYAMGQGQQLFAAMSGKIEYRYTGTGLTAYLRLPNGWTIGYGHLSAPIVPPGTQVTAGQPIALSGGQPGITNPQGMQQAGLGQYGQQPVSVGPGGKSSGPHLEIQLIGPDGRYYDPQPVLQATSGRSASMAVGPMGGGVSGSLDADERPQDGSPAHPPAPREATPAEIGDFADQARGHGLTPDDITRLMPVVAPLRRMLLEKGTDLADLVPHVGFSEQDILQQVRNTAHPVYPHLTAGEMMDSFRHASLHSASLAGRFPTMGEAADFASAKSNAAQMQNYYTQLNPQAKDTSTARAEALGQRQQDRDQ